MNLNSKKIKCNILAIETTGKEASVAFINEEGKLLSESSKEEMNHLKNLMPMIDNLLVKCKLEIDDITHIAVSEGPGSFTGIRIGITTARTLAQVLSLKTIGVPTLKTFGEALDIKSFREDSLEWEELTCGQMQKRNSSIRSAQLLICPIFDARRNQVYGSAFFSENDQCKCKEDSFGNEKFYSHEAHGEPGDSVIRMEPIEIIPDGPYDLTAFLKAIYDGTLAYPNLNIRFYGDGLDKYRNEIEAWAAMLETISKGQKTVSLAEGEATYQNAVCVAKLALKLLYQGKEKDYRDLLPVYHRRAEAEVKLEEKQRIQEMEAKEQKLESDEFSLI